MRGWILGAALLLAFFPAGRALADAPRTSAETLDAEMLADLELLSDERFEARRDVSSAARGRPTNHEDDFDWLDHEGGESPGPARWQDGMTK